MGSPHNFMNRITATQDIGGRIVPRHIRENFPPEATILDVGAGWGKYRLLLPEHKMDACEIWKPYIVDEYLDTIYDKVIEMDICDYKFEWYDIVIFGDIFEHIDRDRAKEMLEYVSKHCKQFYIVVPYMYQQGTVDGNPYEAHMQPDLTDDLMKKEFGVKLLVIEDDKGVYIK